jgi:ppGpp synthetase/RelA/SpoT-type nucleotidyltranferase
MTNYDDWESLEETELPKERPSTNQVKKAGKALSKVTLTSDKYEDAYSTLLHWRSLHIIPLKLMKAFFNQKTAEVTSEAIVVCRLKRIPSIIAKLKRNNRFALNRLEDISGGRIIVPTLEDIENIKEAVLRTDCDFEVSRERDYLDPTLRDSGYRGIHITYTYNGPKNTYKGLHTELQIRSRIQHAWATAVEIIDTFTGQTLKAGIGGAEWLRFFKVASNAFASIEDKKYLFRNFDELKILEEKLGVVDKLNAYTVSTEKIKTESSGYFILNLNSKTRNILAVPYLDTEIDRAQTEYEMLELKYIDDAHTDIALVSSKSIEELIQAYPNYFVDAEVFIRNLELFL